MYSCTCFEDVTRTTMKWLSDVNEREIELREQWTNSSQCQSNKNLFFKSFSSCARIWKYVGKFSWTTISKIFSTCHRSFDYPAKVIVRCRDETSDDEVAFCSIRKHFFLIDLQIGRRMGDFPPIERRRNPFQITTDFDCHLNDLITFPRA